MLKNNNQIAVKRLSARSLKQNKTRNLFVVLAIVLTTFMFTTVFSIGFSLGKNMSIMMVRMQGTKASITLKQPNRQQIRQAKKAKHLYAAGMRIATGSLSDPQGENAIVLDYYDETEYRKNFCPAISGIQGSYPKADNEIMLSKAALHALKIKKPAQRMEIVLVSGTEQKKFVLSGWFTDYAVTAGGFHGFVSEAYTRSLGLTGEKDGVLSLSAKSGKQGKLLEELDRLVTLSKGQEFETSYDAQEESQGDNLVILAVLGLMGGIIILSGYLLIYNVMYISVTKDIRFYGLLKTIGTSPSQIRKIVRMQSHKLSLIGIPVGILLGTVLSFGVVPMSMKMFTSGAYNSALPSDICFHPLIYMGTIVFAWITVFISCRKPSKLAGKISAVEALKYNGTNNEKVKPKKSTGGGKIYKMAFRNVFREKKRAFLVFASLFMGTMAFLAVDTFLGSMKLENYIEYYLPDDYTIYTNCENEENTEEERKAYCRDAEDLARDIAGISGVTSVSVNRSASVYLNFDPELFRPFLESEYTGEKEMQAAIDYFNTAEGKQEYSCPVIAVSREMMERYNKKARQKMDLDRFEKGEICLIGNVSTAEQADQMFGKSITIVDQESGNPVSVEVGSCMTPRDDYGINIGYYWQTAGAPSCILISDAALKRLTSDVAVDNIIVNCDSKAESAVTARIKELVQTNAAVLQIEIKSEMIRDFQSALAVMHILGGGISIVLILIGVLNFINVMLTGVFTRRGELAVMESIGMTRRQVKKMLTYEGAYYGVITLLIIMTLGNAMIYKIAAMAEKIADYAVFHYPVIPMGMIAVLILLICMAVPAVVYHMISGESVTERLRRGE